MKLRVIDLRDKKAENNGVDFPVVVSLFLCNYLPNIKHLALSGVLNECNIYVEILIKSTPVYSSDYLQLSIYYKDSYIGTMQCDNAYFMYNGIKRYIY